MSHTIDCRGMACPEPVIQTRKALETHSEITVIVDNETAVENITRFAENLGGSVAVVRGADGIRIVVNKGGEPAPLDAGRPAAAAPAGGPLVYVLAAETMGRGDAELGSVLIRAFMHTLTEASRRPDVLVMLNAGVKLAAQGSPVADDLKALEAKGTRILACGTCLNFYGITGKLAAGSVSNMYDIVETMNGAASVITL